MIILLYFCVDMYDYSMEKLRKRLRKELRFDLES